jgi:hypothetical protein
VTAGLVPVKTPEGQAELQTRQLRISQRHRTVLFLVDGRRSADEVRRLAGQAGVPASCFDDLLSRGLIALHEAAGASATPSAVGHGATALVTTQSGVLHIELPLFSAPLPSPRIGEDSLLPPSRTLQPESVQGDSLHSGGMSGRSGFIPELADLGDADFAQARALLVRAVRAEAPVTGSLTLMRLRRAGSRAELHELLAEVEQRINKPHRTLAASQTLASVRELLSRHNNPSLSAA